MKTHTFQITLHGELAEEMNLTAEVLYTALCRAFPYSRMSEWEVAEGTIGVVEVTDDDMMKLLTKAIEDNNAYLVKWCKKALMPAVELERFPEWEREGIARERAQAREFIARLIMETR